MGSSLGSVDTLWILFVLAPRLSVPGCHCLVSGFTFYLQKLVSAYALNQNPHWVESRCPYRLKHPVSIQWHPVMLFSFFSLSWLRLLPLPSPPHPPFARCCYLGCLCFDPWILPCWATLWLIEGFLSTWCAERLSEWVWATNGFPSRQEQARHAAAPMPLAATPLAGACLEFPFNSEWATWPQH